jgi:hypothetical protein
MMDYDSLKLGTKRKISVPVASRLAIKRIIYTYADKFKCCSCLSYKLFPLSYNNNNEMHNYNLNV